MTADAYATPSAVCPRCDAPLTYDPARGVLACTGRQPSNGNRVGRGLCTGTRVPLTVEGLFTLRRMSAARDRRQATHGG